MAELDAFLGVVRDGGRPVVDAEDGRWAVVHRPRAADGGRASGGPSSWCRREPDRHRRRPSTAPSLLGGSIGLPAEPVPPRPARTVDAVDRGAGHGRDRGRRRRRQDGSAAGGAVRRPRLERSSPWTSTRRVVESINAGRSHVGEEPGLVELVAAAHAAGRLRATTRRHRGRAGRRRRRAHRAGHARRRASSPIIAAWMRRVESIAPGAPSRFARDLRDHAAGRATPAIGIAPRLEESAACPPPVRGRRFSSPSRRNGCTAARPSANLATYPKLVGGLDEASTALARRVLRRRARRRGRGDVVGRGRRVRQARRHDVPRRQHRARQRVRPLCGADRRRHHRGHRGREQPAVQPHPPAGHRRRRALHPGLSALPARSRPGAVARRAGTRGERRPGRPRGRGRGRCRPRTWTAPRCSSSG